MTIKKITFASLAILALLTLPAQAQGEKCSLPLEKKKGGCKAHANMQNTPFLLKLPSPMRMLMKNKEDPKLALTADQKTKLKAQRDDMMPTMMNLKKEIQALKKEIRNACKKNAPFAEQKARVEKLAQLKTQATLTKLKCIEGVKAILDKKQKMYIQELRKTKRAKMKGMKCPSGQCNKKQ